MGCWGCSNLYFLITSDAGYFCMGLTGYLYFLLCGQASVFWNFTLHYMDVYVLGRRGDGDWGRKMLSLPLSEQLPPNRNECTEGPFLPQPSGKTWMPSETLISQGSHLWVQNLLLSGWNNLAELGGVTFDGLEDFQNLLLVSEIDFVLANRYR